MLTSRARALWSAALLACAPAASFGQQQAAKDYPSRPIRLIVPYAAGGVMDFIGHVLGQKMALVTGQNLIVDNRPGGGSAMGNDVVAKSPPAGRADWTHAAMIRPGCASHPTFHHQRRRHRREIRWHDHLRVSGFWNSEI